MKTQTPPTSTARTRSHTISGLGSRLRLAAPPRRKARRLAVAGAALSLTALGACSSDGAPASGPTASGAASTQSSTSSSTQGSTAPTTSTTSAAPARVDKVVKVEIKDDVLGHTITATKLARHIPWPAGNPVAAASFEIVGVEMTVADGDRYTAEVAPSMFTLKAGSSGAISATTEFGKVFGAPLETAKRAEKKTGWLFFKLDRGASGSSAADLQPTRLLGEHHRQVHPGGGVLEADRLRPKPATAQAPHVSNLGGSHRRVRARRRPAPAR